MEYSSLIKELEDTREQLKKQKSLKEMYINRGKETTRELERLRKYSEDATLSQAKIATQVRDNTRQKKKKDLHKDYEELKVAYLINEEKYQADLRAEKDKNNLLQKELDRINVSHNEIRLRNDADVFEARQQVETLQHELRKGVQQRKLLQKQHEELKMAHKSSQDKFTAELHAEQQKNNLLQDKLDRISQGYESEVVTVRQQAESLQRELEKEVKAHADTVAKDLQVITNLKAEQDDLHHRMTEEIHCLQQNTLEKDGRYERQLEELKAQLAVQTSLNLELSTELKASKEAEVPEETAYEQESIDTASTPELFEVTKVPEVKAHEQESTTTASAPELLEVTEVPEVKAYEQEFIATASAPELLEVTEVPEMKAYEQESTATASAPESLAVTEVPEVKAYEQEFIAAASAPELLKVTEVPEMKAHEQKSIAAASAPELLKVTKVPEEKACEQESIDTASAPELLDMTQVSEETQPKKLSWKRARHFLGLKKPQKWKK